MVEPWRIVQQGYDAIADSYLRYRLDMVSREERAFLGRVVAALPPRATVLELGCGPGMPFTAALGDIARVVAVDVSATQLELARARVPGASFVQADMATLGVRPACLDAVVSFASIGHVPRAQHAELYRSIGTWLRPRGVFAAQVPTGDNPAELSEDWMGVPMYFSHPDLERTLSMLRDVGFTLAHVEEVRGLEPEGDVGRWAGVIARNQAA